MCVPARDMVFWADRWKNISTAACLRGASVEEGAPRFARFRLRSMRSRARKGMGGTRKGPRRVRSDGGPSLPIFRTARGAGQARARTGWAARLGAAALPGSYRLVTYLRASGSRGPRGAAGDGWAICDGSRDLGTCTAGLPPIVRSPMCDSAGIRIHQAAHGAVAARMAPASPIGWAEPGRRSNVPHLAV